MRRKIGKIDWLRESYIRMLIESGTQGDDLDNALAAIQRVNKRLAQNNLNEKRVPLYEQSAQAFREWCIARDIKYDDLTEEEVLQLVTEGAETIRNDKG